ncbi:probable G-protein coupled receptor 141 [Nematolebias whitei]|uniref:probable G-protein coupled receptor 141 n=1 Tax=Nematolebias whitei TaxID=451745 RepID=UPI00189AB514|nr:probable G-protein coupled receptor 141 [Nematolebias whitei]
MMSSTEINTQSSVTTVSSYVEHKEYHTTLLVIHSVVLLCGTVSLSLMVHIMRHGTASSTSCAVLNLIFAHFVFLLTAPFRIYYYVTDTWSMGSMWCKVVSAMIHVHMYMSFTLYVIILVTRLLPHYCKAARVASFSRMHALIAIGFIWLVVLIATPCIIYFNYGMGNDTDHPTTRCFNFGDNIKYVKELNYFVSTFIIVVAVVLTALQANVIWNLYRKYQRKCTSQQDFGAQLKSLLFALVMVVCYVPYHIFRLYYIERPDLENINEVFLSLTTFSCLDMLTFLGRRTCNMCFPGNGS